MSADSLREEFIIFASEKFGIRPERGVDLHNDLYNEPFPETVAGRKDVFVGDQGAATSVGPVGLRGSQVQ